MSIEVVETNACRQITDVLLSPEIAPAFITETATSTGNGVVRLSSWPVAAGLAVGHGRDQSEGRRSATCTSNLSTPAGKRCCRCWAFSEFERENYS